MYSIWTIVRLWDQKEGQLEKGGLSNKHHT